MTNLYPSKNILYLDSNIKVYDLTKYAGYFSNKNNNLDLEKIKKIKFSGNNKESINFGFTDSIYWFKVNIIPIIKDIKWIMDIGYPPLDNITVYLNNVKIFEGGDRYCFNKREIDTPTYAFSLNLLVNRLNTIYIKVKTSSSMQFPLKIYPEKVFFQTQLNNSIIQGIFSGILLVMVFYNLFIFISVKDKTYLIYIIYVSSVLFFYLTINGLVFKYIFPDNTVANNRALTFTVNSITFWGTLFGITFLNIKKYNKYLWMILSILCGVSLLLLICSPFFSYSAEIQISAALSMVLAILLLLAGIISLYKGYKPALYYVIGWLTLLIGGVILVMNKFGIVPQNIFTNNVLQIGSVIEVIFLSFSLGERINNLKEEKKRVELENLSNQALMAEASRRFVPDQFLKYLEKESIVDIKMGDAVERNMTILFNDIRNFTSLSEQMDVRDNFGFLNSYFKIMNPVINKNNGFIDKFIGDSIMALFPEKPDHGIYAAIEMQKLLNDYNADRKKEGYKPIKIGIGLNYGKLMLGTVGSDERLSTTVIGDAVNLASRIEQLTKYYGVKILITDNVFKNIDMKNKFLLRGIDIVRVKGKKEPVEIYEVFDCDEGAVLKKKLKFLEKFNIGLKFYRNKEFEHALKIFKYIFSSFREDFVVKMYIERCESLLKNFPEKWDCVTKFYSKENL